MGVGGLVPMAAGCLGLRAFTASSSFALLSFARASGGARALDRAAGCPWGVSWGRAARVKVSREWGIGGVLPLAAGGMGPHAFTASCSLALVSFAGASGGASASDRGSGCPGGVHRIMFFCSGVFCQGFRRGKGFRSSCWLPLGVPWGRGARVEVRQVWFVRGVVPMAAGGMGPCAFAASCPLLWCLLPLGGCHGAEVRVSR